jgi:TonB family protein
MRLIFLFLTTLPVFSRAQYDNAHRYATTYSSSKHTVELTIVITPSSTDYSDIYNLELLYIETSNETGVSYSKGELYFTKFVSDQLYVSKEAHSVPTKKAIGTITEGTITLTDFKILSLKPDDVEELHFTRQGVIEINAAGPDDDMIPPPPPANPPDPEQYESPDTIEVISNFAEVAPHFPGGADSLQQFFRENITFPKDAGCTEGRVYVQFIVREDGSLTDVIVLKGVTPALDKEALRVVSLMPKWIPGSEGGKVVAVRYTMPVRFLME